MSETDVAILTCAVLLLWASFATLEMFHQSDLKRIYKRRYEKAMDGWKQSILELDLDMQISQVLYDMEER